MEHDFKALIITATLTHNHYSKNRHRSEISAMFINQFIMFSPSRILLGNYNKRVVDRVSAMNWVGVVVEKWGRGRGRPPLVVGRGDAVFNPRSLTQPEA